MKKLSLKLERLTELGSEELAQAVAAGPDSSYTGRPGCVLSFEPPCVSSFCTLLCNER